MGIKVMQFNVLMGSNPHRIFQMITDEQPDVLCFQEATSNPSGNMGHFTFLQRLQAAHPDFRYIHYSPLMSATMNGDPVFDGRLLASKFPLEDYSELHLATGHHFAKPGELSNTYEFKAQFARVMAPEPFIVINHHGYIDGADSTDKRGTPITDDHARRILAHAATMGDKRIVFCGDLNVSPTSTTVKIITETLRDNVTEAGITNTRAPYVTLPPHVCDYIFTSPDIKVTSIRAAGAPHEVCSDHLALFAEFN